MSLFALAARVLACLAALAASAVATQAESYPTKPIRIVGKPE